MSTKQVLESLLWDVYRLSDESRQHPTDLWAMGRRFGHCEACELILKAIRAERAAEAALSPSPGEA